MQIEYLYEHYDGRTGAGETIFGAMYEALEDDFESVRAGIRKRTAFKKDVSRMYDRYDRFVGKVKREYRP